MESLVQRKWALKVLLAIPAILITAAYMLSQLWDPAKPDSAFTFYLGVAIWNATPLIVWGLLSMVLPSDFYFPSLIALFVFSILLIWEIAHDSSSTAGIGYLFTPVLIVMLGAPAGLAISFSNRAYRHLSPSMLIILIATLSLFACVNLLGPVNLWLPLPSWELDRFGQKVFSPAAFVFDLTACYGLAALAYWLCQKFIFRSEMPPERPAHREADA